METNWQFELANGKQALAEDVEMAARAEIARQREQRRQAHDADLHLVPMEQGLPRRGRY